MGFWKRRGIPADASPSERPQSRSVTEEPAEAPADADTAGAPAEAPADAYGYSWDPTPDYVLASSVGYEVGVALSAGGRDRTEADQALEAMVATELESRFHGLYTVRPSHTAVAQDQARAELDRAERSAERARIHAERSAREAQRERERQRKRELQCELEREHQRELERELERKRRAAAARAAAAERDPVHKRRRKEMEEEERRRKKAAREAEAHRPQPQPFGVSDQGAEKLVAEWVRYLGFRDVEVTAYVGDGGIDVQSSTCIAQVKNYSNPVGAPSVRELAGVASGDPDKRQALFFAASGYTDTALREATTYRMALFVYDAAEGSLRANNSYAAQVLSEVEKRHTEFPDL